MGKSDCNECVTSVQISFLYSGRSVGARNQWRAQKPVWNRGWEVLLPLTSTPKSKNNKDVWVWMCPLSLVSFRLLLSYRRSWDKQQDSEHIYHNITETLSILINGTIHSGGGGTTEFIYCGMISFFSLQYWRAWHYGKRMTLLSVWSWKKCTKTKLAPV